MAGAHSSLGRWPAFARAVRPKQARAHPSLAEGARSRPTPLVDLPLGATEDRLVGSLNLETAVQAGKKQFEPGLLAESHRGILYVDEVNLLEDYLVDVLLDAAAMGVNVVEREGVSLAHPSRFMLIGTMNPEEGELRPQFIDRFGLCVAVEGIVDPAERTEVVQRYLDFEADPDQFRDSWAEQGERLSSRIVAARELLPEVECAVELVAYACSATTAVEVQGHRADITLVKAAQALAALEGRTKVTTDDIRACAQLVLPHRMRRDPSQEPELDRKRLTQALEV